MIVHGHYPSELLKSTIVSIPKDKTLSNNDNYRGISMFNSIHKCGKNNMTNKKYLIYTAKGPIKVA